MRHGHIQELKSELDHLFAKCSQVAAIAAIQCQQSYTALEEPGPLDTFDQKMAIARWELFNQDGLLQFILPWDLERVIDEQHALMGGPLQACHVNHLHGIVWIAVSLKSLH